MMIPRLQMSVRQSQFSELACSGELKSLVPTLELYFSSSSSALDSTQTCSIEVFQCFTFLARPKSMILHFPRLSSITLWSFISRWIMRLLCRQLSPWTISVASQQLRRLSDGVSLALPREMFLLAMKSCRFQWHSSLRRQIFIYLQSLSAVPSPRVRAEGWFLGLSSALNSAIFECSEDVLPKTMSSELLDSSNTTISNQASLEGYSSLSSAFSSSEQGSSSIQEEWQARM